MAMSMGNSGGRMSEMNVTPMIDILLVLLIIFMVIVPVTQKGLEAMVPQPPKTTGIDTPRAVVVQVFDRSGAAPAYKINDLDVTHAELLPKLTEIFSNRAERVMFVKGGDHVEFASIADVIDIARAANVDHIGLMTSKIQAGQ
jgi:biopolymer transport protein ExbD